MTPEPAPARSAHRLPAPPVAAWKTLRALLAGSAPGRRPAAAGSRAGDAAVVDAAILGGVVELTSARAPALAEALTPHREALARWDMGLQLVTHEVARALAGANIPAALLKGGATAWLVYEHPAQRERRDVDLLVSAAHFHRAVAVLAALPGWRAVPPRAWWSRADVEHERAAARALGAASVECDVHRRLTLTRHLNIDHAAVLTRAVRPVGAPMAVASLEDVTLHTALHAAANGLRVPLRTWWDLRSLLVCQELDVPTLIHRARRWGAGTALWIAALVVRRWFQVTRPPLDAALAPPTGTRRLLHALLQGQGASPLTWDHGASRRLIKAVALADGRVSGVAPLAREYARLACARGPSSFP